MITHNQQMEIQRLLSVMTLEEKIGQLNQCGPSLVGAFQVGFDELLNMMFDGRISEEEFGKLVSTAHRDFHEEDLRAGLIGSYNGINDAKTANKLQKIAVEETRLGIPLLFGYDVVHGFRTVTPIPLAEACAWEPELWEETARMAAREATAAGIHMTFAPMVDVGKDARWGRVSEGAGEDVYLVSCYGKAKVAGFQSANLAASDSMAACVKHFAGYGAVEAGRDYNRVDMSMQKLYEEYLPPYKACIEAGARAVMPAFNDINGIPCTVNEWLLKDVLRKAWGFDGMTVSDANAIAECVAHGIAADAREVAAQALQAGMEMDMGSSVYKENIRDLVEKGKVDEKQLDQAVSDILRVKMELGLFDNPYQTTELREEKEILKPEYRTVARKAAVKSIVLLKNENVLPLNVTEKIGIIGKLAKNRTEMLGAWAIAGDGNDCISMIDAFEQYRISYSFLEGMKDGEVDSEGLDELAGSCDVFLFVSGENKDESGEAASRADITLKGEQLALLETLKTYGKPVVTVLFNGRPLAIPEVAEWSDALVEAWHPGVEAGNAVYDILFGKVNPSAKLTMTFPDKTGQCPMYYAHINTGRPGGKSKFTSRYLDAPIEPLFPFGFGLSYTNYEYSGLTVKKAEKVLCVEAEITNTGKWDGEEIVQCYVRDLAASRVRPVKQLKAFSKMKLRAGETKKALFRISFDSLGFYDRKMKYIVEPGEFEIFVGGSSADCMSVIVRLEESELSAGIEKNGG